MDEIWKPIKNYEGFYEISNFGRVKSLNYKRSGRAELLIPFERGSGYLGVSLSKDGKCKNFQLHRLVAETFLPNPDNLPEVNHKDEDKTNNFVGTPENDYKDGNLEYCTHEYNSNYGTRNERMRKTLTNGKLSKTVLQFTKSGEFIREWESTQECGRNGYNFSLVAACCRGEQKTSYGFLWKYK